MTLTHIYGKIYNTYFYAPKDLMLHWIDLFPNLVVIGEQVVLWNKIYFLLLLLSSRFHVLLWRSESFSLPGCTDEEVESWEALPIDFSNIPHLDSNSTTLFQYVLLYPGYAPARQLRLSSPEGRPFPKIKWDNFLQTLFSSACPA